MKLVFICALAVYSTQIPEPVSADNTTQRNLPGRVPTAPDQVPEEFNETVLANRAFALQRFILPFKRYCGLQHSDDRLYNHTQTALDEAPWLVNFVARHHLSTRGPPQRDDFYAYCAGVLISRQYLISAGYCSYKNYIIEAARLGQYHPRQNISCMPDPVAEEDCTNKFVDIPIQKFLSVGDTNLFIYRLAQKVSFTDYIRPICLPWNDTKRPGEGDLVVSSGWGDYGGTLISKKRLVSKIVSAENCKPLNDSVLFGDINRDYAMCVQKQELSNAHGKQGDQGGPFAFSIKHKWYLDGVINHVKDDYLIGEKITPKILDWILDALYDLHINPYF